MSGEKVEFKKGDVFKSLKRFEKRLTEYCYENYCSTTVRSSQKMKSDDEARNEKFVYTRLQVVCSHSGDIRNIVDPGERVKENTVTI